MPECTELRIGTAVATLHYLRNRGVPEPDAWTFNDYSVRRVAGNGLPLGYGFPTASWSWEGLAQDQLNVFLDFFDADGDAGVQVYISTYTNTGRRRTTTDYTAYMSRPVDGEGMTIYPRSSGKVWQSVTISFSHLEAA